ncbi:tripartite motif containing 101 isoform X1 [Lates calcarifer]|uniref:RING-type E3 ubiquitin transferase n=1 Tax=Lates calcarifer TaxID=8187 RepID=A0AAJ7V723_LATCA|nr:tripartite motif containing 101 isoform X1 [Lates calcarifer]
MQRNISKQEEVKFGGAAMSLPVELSCLQGAGGADREAALATLEKQLICPICLELFNKPVVILPCQHNLCRKCANELYQPSLFQARTTMMVNSGRFRCPSCRHEVVLDRHGVYGLQRNLLVENIIDVYKQEVLNNTAISPLPPPPPLPVEPTCSDHEGEKVNIYCLTCQVPTCSLCKVFGAHQSCQVAPLMDVYQQQKDELNEGVSSLVAVNNKTQALIDELEETCRRIEENCKAQKQSVCDQFSCMFSILEERHKAMARRISSEEEEKTGHAQALVRCYGDSVEANNKLMERAASSMEEPDMAGFVQNSRELITKVIAASSSCPTETLKPGYENMSHYQFNFSRQERVLKSIDFIKDVVDVPEEPEVEPEPEEAKEPSVQITEPTHHQETSTQDLDSVVEPVKEAIPPPVISPTVEAVQAAAATPVLTPPAPQLLRDPVEPAEADLQPETDDTDLNDEGSGQIKNRKEEEERDEAEAPASVKEANICEHQEGMSTQQCEGGETESDAGDWTAQRETEVKQGAQCEEEEIQVKEGTDAVFYPSWYKPGSRRSGSPDQTVCSSTQPTEDSLSEARTWTETDPNQPPSGPAPSAHLQQRQLPLSTQLHAQPFFPLPQPPHQPQSLPPLPESQSQHHMMSTEMDSAFVSVPQVLARQTAGEAAAVEEENEEEEDMQGWVCLPGTVEGSFGDSSLDSCSDNNDTTLSAPPEETSSGMDKDNFKLSDGRAEDAEEEEQLKEDILGFKDASGLEGKGLGRSHFEAETADERGDVLRDDFSRLQRNAVATREDTSEVKNDALDVLDHGAESTSSLIQGGGEAEFEAGSLTFAENKQEDGENSEQPDDFNDKMETSVAEPEEKITSCVSLQRETETRSPAKTSPPLSSSSSSSAFTLSEAPRRPSFCFSWLNPLHKKK